MALSRAAAGRWAPAVLVRPASVAGDLGDDPEFFDEDQPVAGVEQLELHLVQPERRVLADDDACLPVSFSSAGELPRFLFSR